MDRISKNNYKNKIQLFKSRKSLIIFSVIMLILVIVFSICATYIYQANGSLSDAALNMMADVVGDDTPITVLVLGVSEDIDTALTDTMMLVSYNPKMQKSFVVSIPRDTYIGANKAKAGGSDKINSLYQSNVKKTVSAVEKLTGVKIDNYIVVKTSALIDIVDAIGGVQFDVPIDMKYDDPTQNLHIDLKAGMQLVDGDKAEQLLRFRHSNPDANGKMTTYPASYGLDDYGRMRTQREFMQATAKQLVNWKNITKLKNIATAVFDNLETDMSLSKIIGYIPSALKLDVDSLRMEQLPGVSDKINELWFYVANSTDTCKLMNELMVELELNETELASMYTPIKKDIPIVAKTENTYIENTIVEKQTENYVVENKVNTTTALANSEPIKKDDEPKVCTHNWAVTSRTDATCTKAGVINYTCTNCSATKLETIKALKHDMQKISETVATETKQGLIEYKCTRCSHTEVEYLPVLSLKNQ